MTRGERGIDVWFLLPFLPPEQLITVAMHAEEVGFAGVAVADHAANPELIKTQYPYGERRGRGQILPSPCVMIAAMAVATTTLRFTTWVLVVPLRHPILLAKEIATAARIARGRMDLGIGSGWMREEFEAVGIEPSTRARRMDETVALMRRLWTGEFVASDSDLFRFAPNQVLPTLETPPRILVGGHRSKALDRAARTADGWVGAFMGHDELAGVVAELGSLRARYGRTGMPFEIRLSSASPVSEADLARLAEIGVRSVIITPWHVTDDPMSLEAVLKGMSAFGSTMLNR
jgi:probable F420-dependent oxidoreductase